MPAWHLSVVLAALQETPFEPIRKVDLSWLTFKTIFLIMLASGKRRSEVHAFDFDNFARDRKWSYMLLKPSSDFVGKTELANKGPASVQFVRIEALKGSGEQTLADNRLCPVRALKIYIRRTSECRTGKKKLFISFKKGFDKDVCKNTISSWLKKTVAAAYEYSEEEDLQLGRVRAHDIRDLSASCAFLRNVSMEDILAAGSWKSHSTFTNYYLKDLTLISGGLLKLGPLVASQRQV